MTAALQRSRQTMPAFVTQALTEAGVMAAYKDRPPYQRNDYLGWINRAVRLETKQKRLNQMIDELRRGDVYMKMQWRQR